MSTERNPLRSETNDDVYVTSYSGGKVKGPMIQLTQQRTVNGGVLRSVKVQHVNIDKRQALSLIAELSGWLNGE